MFNVSALLLDDALKHATPLTNGAFNETPGQFSPLSDDRLFQLVDCRESSTLIDHLLKGNPNSVIDWIQVRDVWVPHIRLDERDVLTPRVRQCVVQQPINFFKILTQLLSTMFPVIYLTTTIIFNVSQNKPTARNRNRKTVKWISTETLFQVMVTGSYSLTGFTHSNAK